MLAKSWKKICLIILIIACLWNIILKFVNILSFDKVVHEYQEEYMQEQATNTQK